MSDTPAIQNACLNCSALFVGNYCPSCGQKHGPAMPTTGEIVGDFLRSALSPSGKVVETFWTLLRRPGELTRAFNAGQRMRYVHPVRVYLLCVFVFVAAITLNHTIRKWMNQPPFEAEMSAVFSGAGNTQQEAAQTKPTGGQNATSKAQETGRAVGSMLPGWVRDRLKARIARKPELDRAAYQQRVSDAMSKHSSALFAALVPFLALLNWGLYAGRGVTYAGHFVFLLHTTAANCLLLVPIYALNLPVAYFPAVFAVMVWSVLAARRAFAVSLWGAMWRYLVYLIPSMLVAALAGAVVGIASVLFMD